MKYLQSKYTIILFLGLLSLIPITSCSSDGGGNDGQSDTPSNLVVTADIVGTSTANPNGDGSGLVHFNVSADNATSYKVLIEGQTINTTSGVFSHSCHKFNE